MTYKVMKHYLHYSLQVFYQPVLLQDPETTPRGKSKHGLKLGPGCDLTKIFVKVCYSSSTHLRVKPRASGLQMLLAKSATSDFYIFIVNCVNQLKPKTTLKYSNGNGALKQVSSDLGLALRVEAFLYICTWK